MYTNKLEGQAVSALLRIYNSFLIDGHFHQLSIVDGLNKYGGSRVELS